MIRKLTFVILGIIFYDGLLAQTTLPVDTIECYFNRVKQISENDNGKLWGIPIYGPILVIDRKTRMLVANEPDNENLLVKEGNVYTGTFPGNLIISNSTTRFGGKLWTMVAYPFSGDDDDINLLFTHELFHRLQSVMGLQDYGYDNSHMDKADARIYMKLEWLALTTAINSEGDNREVLVDAYLFRKYRRSLYAGADSMENKFEVAEGLAEYTAYSLCFDPADLANAVTKRKNKAWNSESYVRSFGYYSGLLYGYLLDKNNVDWRKTMKYNNDLGTRLQDALHIDYPGNIADLIKTRSEKYGYDTLYSSEFSRNQEKEKKLREYRHRFTSDSTINLKLIHPHYGFNPNNLQPLDSLGIVFPFIELVDDWGKLIVTKNACLISKNWEEAIISSTDLKIYGNEIMGNGWAIKLNDNWHMIRKDERYVIMMRN